MHVHILGICGTFMGGIALIARAMGHRVSGSDANIYPPMSDLLAAQGIGITEGWDPDQLEPVPDCVVVGNALSRGNSAVEAVLERGLAYTSGPQWLADHVLHGRWVLGVAGTHGKTTTSSMLAWILEHAGLGPGFLIGGVPENFGVSARIGQEPFFVVEADEYETAFFDKRSKFVHYRPRTAVLNNLEFDHADIFPDLAAIQRQFHHLVRTVPGNGLIIRPAQDAALSEVMRMGRWSPEQTVGLERADWRARPLAADGSRFRVLFREREHGTVSWDLIGRHNVSNALSAIAAARHAGVAVEEACRALGAFRNVKRRLQVRAVVDDVTIYDDFAHHPTAIRTTLEGLRSRVNTRRIIAVLEPRSNTMRLGVHRDHLADALAGADRILLLRPPELGWDLNAAMASLGDKAGVYDSVAAMVERLRGLAGPGDHILIMSNGAFGGIHDKLIAALRRDAGKQP